MEINDTFPLLGLKRDELRSCIVESFLRHHNKGSLTVLGRSRIIDHASVDSRSSA